jgi:hypothetical protein
VALLAWWKKSTFFKAFLFFLSLDFALYSSREVKWFGFFPDVFIFGMGIATFVVILLFFWEQISKSNLFHLGLSQDENALSAQFRVSKTKTLKENEPFRNIVLLVWFLSVLAIPIIYVHFGAKYLLLAQPPLILILFKILGPNLKKHLKYITVLVCIMLGSSILVAKADFDYANLYRREAEDFFNKEVMSPWVEQRSPQPLVWFTGHWGWQYYLEKSGGLPLSVEQMRKEELTPGDFVVTPKYASAFEIEKPLLDRLQLLKNITLSLELPIRTMNNLAKAGFYSNHWGPLPYYFSWTAPELIGIYRVGATEETPD